MNIKQFKELDVFTDIEAFTGSRDSLECFGGGGKSSSAPAPVYTAPTTAPSVSDASTQDIAETPEEEAKKTKEAQRSGAKSLQIPITSSGDNGGSGTVGTI